MAAQLGREPFVPFEVVARCGTGHPMVIRNHPTDDFGRHFPTLYWLTCPDWSKAVARLESAGWVKRLEQRVETDPNLRTRLRRAHEEYARERGTIVPGAQNWGGVGGSRQGVKCLHAHYAYTVAGGSDPIGNWVHRTLQEGQPIHYERPTNRIAAIDLGTNSIRLLVTKASREEGLTGELARDMVITRIGEGVDSSGRIDPAALRRTIEVLRRYVRRARALGAERIHLAATSAVRDAKNRDELAEAVLGYTGEPMDVLSGAEEARTTFLGATRGLKLGPQDPGAPYLVMDIGGGSTEFVLGRDGPQAWISTQMGSVRLTERFVKSDPPSPEELARLEEEVDDVLAEAERAVQVRSARTLVAVAGTSTTVQAMALGMVEYDPTEIHGSTLAARDAERVAQMLADMTTRERKAIPVMPPGREDVIPAGAAILVRAMRRWGFEQATLSETDILDGLALRMVEDGLRELREVEVPSRVWAPRRVFGG